LRLYEQQSKKILADFGIPVPRRILVTNGRDAAKAAMQLGGDVMVKTQVLAGGRGKSGGILRAKDAGEAHALTEEILRKGIRGFLVDCVLIEECIPTEMETYLAMTVDLDKGEPVVIASVSGGMDIEELALKSPQDIIRTWINPIQGYPEKCGIDIASRMGLPQRYRGAFSDIAIRMWQLFKDCDATLVEINPLGGTNDGQLVALDAKVIIDDNALFRHPDLELLRTDNLDKPIEVEARKHGLAYVQLEGEVGCIVNGAGLAMAIMDMVVTTNGRPGNFLDIGGGAGAEKVKSALRIILSDKKIKIILLNIFGGITRCDVIARGILEAVDTLQPGIPIVVRLAGTNAEIGNAMLAGKNIVSKTSLSDALDYIDGYLRTCLDEHINK